MMINIKDTLCVKANAINHFILIPQIIKDKETEQEKNVYVLSIYFKKEELELLKSPVVFYFDTETEAKEIYRTLYEKLNFLILQQR